MIGYHYTTLENWNIIKADGLKPTPLMEYDLPGVNVDHSALHFYFKNRMPNCIWVWKYELTQPTHLGTLLFQMLTKVSFEIVVIEVEYRKKDQLKPYTLEPFQKYSYNHTGTIGAWKHHKDVPFDLLKKRIPPERLKLKEYYNFITLTNGGDRE